MQEREPLILGTPLDGAIQLPYLRLDPMRLLSGLGCRYGQLGIKRSGSLWGEELKKAIANNDQTVICAGAHSVGLLEHLHLPVPDLLKLSWAGVWHIPDLAMGGERVLMPLQGLRQQGEQAIGINQPQMVLDPGMAPGPGGDGILLGQTSWFGLSLEKPPNQIQDRQALIAAAELLLPRDIDAVLDSGEWHQQPVSFSSDGLPLVGLLLPDQAISLCAGFSMAFALVPVLVPLVAEAIIDLDWQPLKRLGLHLQRSS
jgi:glycine/D-amino acid oxidase-like deaminating enzyme